MLIPTFLHFLLAPLGTKIVCLLPLIQIIIILFIINPLFKGRLQIIKCISALNKKRKKLTLKIYLNKSILKLIYVVQFTVFLLIINFINFHTVFMKICFYILVKKKFFSFNSLELYCA